MKFLTTVLALALLFFGCKKDDNSTSTSSVPQLIIKFKFDPNQQRLNNLGNPASIPDSHAAQSPMINKMSANYIELAPDKYTALGKGEVIYLGPRTTQGGDTAIDFAESIFKGDGDTYISIPLKEVANGNYQWVRISLAYQEGQINFLSNGVDYKGTLASFVGFNTFISTFQLNGQILTVNENKKQGFWGFEALGYTTQGQAPAGATTVPNPLFATSPIPQGSCVVTGEFENGLHITGNETNDITVTLSFSINNSFEWIEVNKDGKYEPKAGEKVVDMGLRGVIPSITY